MGALLLLTVLLAGCASLPRQDGRTVTSALTDTEETPLGRAVQAAAAAHPGESGVRGLLIPREAFAARVVLARYAERSLDMQYYIWHADTTGFLMFEEVWKAAERGVRVRMLLTTTELRVSIPPSPPSTATPTSRCGSGTRT